MLSAAARRSFGSFRLPGNVRLDISNDSIVQVSVSCIVNAAKRSLEGGGGVDGAIHAAAGSGLLKACKALPVVERGVRCRTGEAKLTAGPFATTLAAQHIIHVVGPDLREGVSPAAAEVLLKNAISSALSLANSAGYESVALPAVSCGVYAGDNDEWMNAAPGFILEACVAFMLALEAMSIGPCVPPVSISRIVLCGIHSSCSSWARAAVTLGLAAFESATSASDAIDSGVSSLSASRSTAAPVAASASSGAASGIPFAFNIPSSSSSIDGGPLCRFLSIADWGDSEIELTQNLAANMAAWISAQGTLGRPDFIAAVGDNFYPSGVSSVRCVER